MHIHTRQFVDIPLVNRVPSPNEKQVWHAMVYCISRFCNPRKQTYTRQHTTPVMPHTSVLEQSTKLRLRLQGFLSRNNGKMAWWRQQMETFSALLANGAGNSPITGEFPAQRQVTLSFDVFLDLRLSKRLGKQRRGRWFDTPSHPLWRHCNCSHSYKRWWYT